MIAFVLLFCGLAIQGMGDAVCTSSAKIQMSRSFIPAAMAALTPLGFGTCNTSNGTCLTPPANCPDSSCCLKGIRSGSCGCAEEGLEAEWGDGVCTDPKAFRVAVNTCDDTGARNSTQLQLFAVPAFEECKEEATVQVTNNKGKLQINVQFSLCGAAHTAQKDANKKHPTRKRRGQTYTTTISAWGVNGNLEIVFPSSNGDNRGK